MTKLILLLLCLCIGIEGRDNTYGNVIVTKILRIYDGDTFFADIDCYPDVLGENIGIRIRGIDTPEVRTRSLREKTMAYRVRNIVSNLLRSADVVYLKNISRGKYFRLIADVYADTTNVGEYLLNKKLAKDYDGGTKEKWFE